MNRTKVSLALLTLLSFWGSTSAGADGIFQSKHNLSSAGPGMAKALSEAEVCIFCHAPHTVGQATPLWNRYSSGATYIPYSSSTAVATHGQPTGTSKLCLGCHDGTVAYGMVRSRATTVPFSGGAGFSGGTALGVDLSDDHPISFEFDQSLYARHEGLVNPSLLAGAVRLDAEGNVQCTSCHDPHEDRNGKFLVMTDRGSALCAACHDPAGWTGSVHRLSNATWNGQAPNPWPHKEYGSVSENACENCHRPHRAGRAERLMIFPSLQDNCLSCHSGNVARKDISVEFAKTSTHGATNPGLHDPAEDLISAQRHSTCVDCHNPHAASQLPAETPFTPGALAGVKGLSSSGTPVASITFEYELCFRCHGDSPNKGPARVNRQFIETSTRKEMSLSNPSYHPVVGAGRNPNVPSLIDGYTPFSTIRCTDCHNNDRGPGAGGNGPNGPHGSRYSPILERSLVLTDGTREGPATYALCYKCHARSSIIENESFKGHKKHVDHDSACTTCHDPHGVESATHLINFNTDYVKPAPSGRLQFVDTGVFRGECYLTCHGEVHDPLRYP